MSGPAIDDRFLGELRGPGVPAPDLRGGYDVSIGRMIDALRRHAGLAALVLALVLGSAAAYGMVTAKRYTSAAMIQLDFAGAGGLVIATPRFEGALTASPVALDATALVKDAMAILSSRALAHKVALAVGPEPERAGGLAQIGAFLGPVLGPAPDILKGIVPPMAGLTGEAPTSSTTALDLRIRHLQEGLEVRNDGKSYMIELAYTAGTPKRAALVANVFAETYLQSQFDVGRTRARRASAWLADQVAEAELEVAEAIVREKVFAGTDAGPTPIGVLSVSEQQVRDLVAQVSAMRVALLESERRAARLREAEVADRSPLAADVADYERVRQALAAELTAEAAVRTVLETLKPGHPRVRVAEAAREAARQSRRDAMTEAVRLAAADSVGVRAALAGLEDRLEAGRVDAGLDAAAARTLARLEADTDAARARRDSLGQRYREALAMVELSPNASELVSRAEPIPRPSSPRLLAFLVLGALAGGVASVGSVFALEMRETGLTSAEQAARTLGIPCAGLVPTTPTHRSGNRSRSSDHALHEDALRALAVRAGLLDPGSGPRLIVVASAYPNEGKTALVRGLASVLAQEDVRVAVVENAADRSPNASQTGLDRADAGEVSLVAQSSLGSADGDVAFRAYRRAGAMRLPRFERMQGLRDWLSEHGGQFDLVLVEAPAVLLDARAIALMRTADLVLFAAAWRRTPREAVAGALAQAFGRKNTERAALVLTDVQVRRYRRYRQHDRLSLQDRYRKRNRLARDVRSAGPDQMGWGRTG